MNEPTNDEEDGPTTTHSAERQQVGPDEYGAVSERRRALLVFIGSRRWVLVPSCWRHSRDHGGGGLVVFYSIR